MQKKDLKGLLEGYLRAELSASELEDFIRRMQSDEDFEALKSMVSREALASDFMHNEARTFASHDELFRDILLRARIEETRKNTNLPRMRPVGILWRRTYVKISMAAVLALSLFSLSYLYLIKDFNEGPDPATTRVSIANDINPGSEKAILTLSDGSKIVLDSKDSGRNLGIAGGHIIRRENGMVQYAASPSPGLSKQYNVLQTPYGGKYRIILSDGSKVWLNAATSLRYPVVFTGSERLVELDGEAYFEVEKNKTMPFRVRVNNTTVRVLGTHFNVMGYADEKLVKTTLIEGAVMVNTNNKKALLRPGEEAAVQNEKQDISVAAADTEQALAWKNDLFIFNASGIETIMRQLRRWYDVTIEYQTMLPGKKFSGSISRNTNLSQVLKMLELTQEVRFAVQGKQITVLQ